MRMLLGQRCEDFIINDDTRSEISLSVRAVLARPPHESELANGSGDNLVTVDWTRFTGLALRASLPLSPTTAGV